MPAVNKKTQKLLQQILSGLLFLAAIVMLGWLSVRYSVKQDWTANNRNTLTDASQKQLASMGEPVRIVAFSYPGGEDRATVQYFADQYQRFKPDVSLEFIDPSSQPQKVKDYNIAFAGEVVLEYQGRRENLRTMSEQAITTALQRLAYSGERWIVFLEGHGERSVTEASSQEAFTQFAQVLRDKGLKVQPLSLVQTLKVPDNTAVLVIASPTSQLLEGEVRLIDEYVKGGGNLLWFADPGVKPGIDALAKSLGIDWQDGYAVFPEYELLGTGHPGIFAAIGYPPNPVTRGLSQVTLFPLVRSLTAAENSGWTAQPMLSSSPEAWLETGSMDGQSVAFDEKAGDIRGPLDIGMSLTREFTPAAETDAKPDAEKPASREQRVALVGDADFLANAGLNQLGNQQLGLNLVQWLASRDEQLNIDVRSAPDTSLFLPDWALVLLVAGFAIVLPIALLGVGVTRWVIRRRR